MLVASTAPLRSTMSARWVRIGSPQMPARGSTGTGGGEQRHPPGDRREAEDEDDPEEQEPGLRLGALGAVAGGQARGALLGLDEVRILALGAGLQDAGERAQRTADHGVAPAVVTRSAGSGGKATVAASPNWSGVSSASPSASAFWRASSRSRSGRLR